MWDRVDRNTIVLAVLGGVAAIAVLIVLVVTFAGPAGVPFGATPMPEAVATLAPTPTAAYQGYEPPPGTFFGDFNGFTFFNPVLESIGAAPACNGTPTTGVSDAGGGNATPEDIASSRLDFSPAYLPAGFVLSEAYGIKCGSIVFRIARIYDRPGGNAGPGGLSIMRFDNRPRVPSRWPVDQLQAVTVAGRRAVMIREYPNQLYLYVRDDPGYWILNRRTSPFADAPAASEIIRIAEGVLD